MTPKKLKTPDEFGLEQKALARSLARWEIDWIYANAHFYTGVDQIQSVKEAIIKRHTATTMERVAQYKTFYESQL